MKMEVLPTEKDLLKLVDKRHSLRTVDFNNTTLYVIS